MLLPLLDLGDGDTGGPALGLGLHLVANLHRLEHRKVLDEVEPASSLRRPWSFLDWSVLQADLSIFLTSPLTIAACAMAAPPRSAIERETIAAANLSVPFGFSFVEGFDLVDDNSADLPPRDVWKSDTNILTR